MRLNATCEHYAMISHARFSCAITKRSKTSCTISTNSTKSGSLTDHDAATKHNPAAATVMRQFAFREIQDRLLGSYKGDIRLAERNAIMGREGGISAVIDAIRDGIIKVLTENYVRSVFFEAIAPSDYQTRYRLAEELLKRFGPLLFPNEELLPAAILGHDLEKLVNGFVSHLHGLRRAWRY